MDKLEFTNKFFEQLLIPERPKPPLCRVMREGVGHFCANCSSTMSKSGFLMLLGKRYCDNDKCPNSKPLKRERKKEKKRLVWPTTY